MTLAARLAIGSCMLLTLVLAACGDHGTTTRHEGPARRIVSLAPSHTELLFAIGAGERVVGVSRYCNRPPEASLLPRVGDSKQVALEAIAALDPDLILVNSEALRELLQPLASRTRVLYVKNDTLAELFDAIDVVGKAVGKVDEATALRADLEQAIADARARARTRERTRVLLVVQRNPFFVAGRGSYVSELLALIGCENAADSIDSAWPQLSAEALLTLAPEAIIDAAADAEVFAGGDPDAEVMRFWSQYPTLPAVKNGRVRRLNDEAVVRPGPALREVLATLEQSIAPPPARAPAGSAPRPREDAGDDAGDGAR